MLLLVATPHTGSPVAITAPDLESLVLKMGFNVGPEKFEKIMHRADLIELIGVSEDAKNWEQALSKRMSCFATIFHRDANDGKGEYEYRGFSRIGNLHKAETDYWSKLYKGSEFKSVDIYRGVAYVIDDWRNKPDSSEGKDFLLKMINEMHPNYFTKK